MKIAKTIGAGECFGEISLITEEVRQATVLCKEDCHFMVVD